MRNIFDQYSQPENRITHALMTSLCEGRLLDDFIKKIAGLDLPTKGGPLRVTVQSFPGHVETKAYSEREQEEPGIPDAWVVADEHWCLVIENKVLATPSKDQIIRHLHTARHQGYANPKALLIAADPYNEDMPEEVTTIEWPKIYKWLQNHLDSSGQLRNSVDTRWAQQLSSYLELMEARLTDEGKMTSGALTSFTGFKFGGPNPSNEQGKRVLRLAMRQLRERRDLSTQIDIDPNLEGRGALKGAWDVLGFHSSGDKPFNNNPHLTLSVGDTHVRAMAICPNAATKAWRQLRGLSKGEFNAMVSEVMDNMAHLLKRCPGMEPRLVLLQRHAYAGQKLQTDAEIDIDLRTYHGNQSKVKRQPEWIDGLLDGLKHKDSNLEFQMGASFPYERCQQIQEPQALDLVAKSWIACKPYLSTLGVLS